MLLFRPPVAPGEVSYQHNHMGIGGTAGPPTKTARAQVVSYTITSNQALPKAVVPNQGAFSSGAMWQYLEAFSVVISGCVGDASDI